MVIQTWLSFIVLSLQNLWMKVAEFLPNLIGAIIVFVIGMVVAAVIGKLIEQLVSGLKIDMMFKRIGLETYLNRANLQLDSGYFLGRLVYWFLLLVFILAASEILGFKSLSIFINDILLYIPNVIVAALIMIATLFIANFLRGLAAVSILGSRLHRGKFLGSLVWWVIFVFGALVAVSQLGVAAAIIETIITGVITMLALAGGLALGLGGKEVAGKILEKVYSEWDHSK